MKSSTEFLYSDQSNFRNLADLAFFSEGNNTQGIILNPLGLSLSTILETSSAE